MSRRLPQHCETCTCEPADTGRGRLDMQAPFYDLVLELDRIVYAEAVELRRSRVAARRVEDAT